MMKHNYFFFTIFWMFISCESKNPIEVRQINSKEVVTLLSNHKNDSIAICLPLEFEMTINSSKVKNVTWNYYVNNKKPSLDGFFDYHLYDKKNKTMPIHELNFDFVQNNKIIYLILKERKHFISKIEAQKLLKKYNIKKSLDSLKFTDTIKLISYDKFRIENKSIINEFNKSTDSINFKVTRGEKYFFYLDKKINW